MGSGEPNRVRWSAFLAFLRYSSASFILSILAWPERDLRTFLVRRAPVVVVVRAADVAIGGLLVVPTVRGAAGFLGAAELPPGFGPNSASRFAFALRL